MVVVVLLSIDIAILTTWQIIDPFFRETKLLDPYVSFLLMWINFLIYNVQTLLYEWEGEDYCYIISVYEV